MAVLEPESWEVAESRKPGESFRVSTISVNRKFLSVSCPGLIEFLFSGASVVKVQGTGFKKGIKLNTKKPELEKQDILE